jgi:hypothetical protein
MHRPGDILLLSSNKIVHQYVVLWRSIVATLEHLTVDRITVEAEKIG